MNEKRRESTEQAHSTMASKVQMEPNPAYGLSTRASAFETSTDMYATWCESGATPGPPQLAYSQTGVETCEPQKGPADVMVTNSSSPTAVVHTDCEVGGHTCRAGPSESSTNPGASESESGGLALRTETSLTSITSAGRGGHVDDLCTESPTTAEYETCAYSQAIVNVINPIQSAGIVVIYEDVH